MFFGSTKLLEGCQRPFQSHCIEHFKGHFVLMDQVLTQTALSAVLVRTILVEKITKRSGFLPSTQFLLCFDTHTERGWIVVADFGPFY